MWLLHHGPLRRRLGCFLFFLTSNSEFMERALWLPWGNCFQIPFLTLKTKIKVQRDLGSERFALRSGRIPNLSCVLECHTFFLFFLMMSRDKTKSSNHVYPNAGLALVNSHLLQFCLSRDLKPVGPSSTLASSPPGPAYGGDCSWWRLTPSLSPVVLAGAV